MHSVAGTIPFEIGDVLYTALFGGLEDFNWPWHLPLKMSITLIASSKQGRLINTTQKSQGSPFDWSLHLCLFSSMLTTSRVSFNLSILIALFLPMVTSSLMSQDALTALNPTLLFCVTFGNADISTPALSRYIGPTHRKEYQTFVNTCPTIRSGYSGLRKSQIMIQVGVRTSYREMCWLEGETGSG